MKDKRTDKEVLSAYNRWVKEQQKLFRGLCPYFTTDETVLNKFSPEHKALWKSAKNSAPKEIPRKIWEILKQNRHLYKSKKDEKEKALLYKEIRYSTTTLSERISSKKSIVMIERVHGPNTFLSLCGNRGFVIPKKHLRWYEENKLLTPVAKNKNSSFYAIYQLYSLVRLEEWKKMTLAYPHDISNGIPILWQKFLLLNKKTITQEIAQWDKVAKLLIEIRDLYACFFEQAAKDIWKQQGKGPIKSKLMNDYLDYYSSIVGKKYAEKIYKKEPSVKTDFLLYWIEVLVHEAQLLNPLLRKASEFPAILRTSHNGVIYANKLGVKSGVSNSLRLSNWYLDLVHLLAFYYECLTEKQVTSPTIVPMLSMRSLISETALCEVCGKSYAPTPNRGGKPQKVCGDEECKKELNRRAAHRNRKKKRIS